MTRRQTVAGMLAAPAIASGAMAGLVTPSSARAARAVTLVGFGGWFQDRLDGGVLNTFRKARPGTPVFFHPVATSAQALTLLRMERYQPSTDIVLLDPTAAGRAAAEGLTEPLTPANMPALKALVPEAILPKGGPVLAWDTLAIGFNPRLILAAPRSWRDLWNGAIGRIAVQTPPDPAGLALTEVAATLFGGKGGLQSLEVGITALTQLAPRIALFDPKPDICTADSLGDAAIGPCWNGHAQLLTTQAPGRFAAVLPDEGSPVLPITINLVKGAPEAESARTLIAWLLGQEAQRALADSMFLAPAIRNPEASEQALSRAGGTAAMVGRRMPMDWELMNALRDQIANAWRQRNLASR